MHTLFSLDGRQLDEFDAYNAKNGHLDYRIEEGRFGGAELKGRRSTQEDRMFSYEFDEDVTNFFSTLVPEKQQEIIEETFKLLNEKIKKEVSDIQSQGSTAIIAITFPNQMRVLSASLGDAQAFSVIIDKNNQLKEIKELNEIHHPSRPAERARLSEFAKSKNMEIIDCVSTTGRLGGRLAVSGAFGDLNYLQYGLREVPDIKDEYFKLESGDRLFILVCCDGLTERDLISLNEIGNMFTSQEDKLLGQLALSLAQKAYDSGSFDNISIQITEMTNQLTKQYENPFMFGVFDGHGGSSVSQYLKNEFTYTFIAVLAKLAPWLQEKIENRLDSTPSTPLIDEELEESEDDISSQDSPQSLTFILGKRKKSSQEDTNDNVPAKKIKYN